MIDFVELSSEAPWLSRIFRWCGAICFVNLHRGNRGSSTPLKGWFLNPRRIPKLSAILKPATLLKFHNALVDHKYRLLFSSSGHRRKPGLKGPSAQLIAAIVEMKRRNPKFGYMRIAQQIASAFGVEIDKDVMRRVLAKHYRPDSGTDGPSWSSLIAQLKDSLWSIDPQPFFAGLCPDFAGNTASPVDDRTKDVEDERPDCRSSVFIGPRRT